MPRLMKPKVLKLRFAERTSIVLYQLKNDDPSDRYQTYHWLRIFNIHLA